MKQNILFCLLFLCNIKIVVAQSNTFSYFNKTFWADTMNTLAPACKPVADGYLIFGGYINAESNEFLYMRKIDQQGNHLWLKIIDDETNGELGIIESGRQVLLNNDQHVLVAYSKDTISTEGWQRNVYLTKMTLTGEVIWKRWYGESNRDEICRHIIQTEDGGYIMAGTKGKPNNVPGASMYIIKVDSDGHLQWDSTYVSNWGQAFSIQQTWQDGGYIIGGYGKTDTSGYDMWIVKIAADGTKLWEKNYGTQHSDGAARITPITNQSEYINYETPIRYLSFGIWRTDPDDNSHTISIAWLDEEGNIVSERHDYDYGYGTIMSYPILLPDKSFLAIAHLGLHVLYHQPHLTHFSAEGDIIWSKKMTIGASYDTSGNHNGLYLKDLQATPDGGYVMAGFNVSSYPQKAWVLKVDAEGNTCSTENCDSTIVISNMMSLNSETLSVRPNPATNRIHIQFKNLIIANKSTISLYDLQGREVYFQSIVGQPNELFIDVSNFHKGMYLMCFRDEKTFWRTKVLLVDE